MSRLLIGIGVAAVFLWALPDASRAQLFSEDFESDPTADWTFNPGPIAADPSDHAANFFFDYSTAGIPLAPNSAAGGTRGLNLQANRDGLGIGAGVFSGMSVSPTGQDFSGAGDYVLKFDWWQNFPGSFPAGSSGTTQLSTYGIGTSGTFANWPGNADGVYFAATLDGQSAADFRAYSQERSVSYQFPPDPAVLDGNGNPVDGHATYHAFSRNNTAGPAGNFVPDGIVDAADYTAWRDHFGETSSDPLLPVPKVNGNANSDLVVDLVDYELWKATFGDTQGLYAKSFGEVTAPAAQLLLYPQQTGTTAPGSTGMEWHEVEIAKIGNSITWTVDGVLLISLDTTDFVTPLGGGNIMFGQSDTNAGASIDPLRFELLFTLIDNIRVEAIPPGSSAVGGTAVPEPATIVMILLGLAASALGRRRL